MSITLNPDRHLNSPPPPPPSDPPSMAPINSDQYREFLKSRLDLACAAVALARASSLKSVDSGNVAQTQSILPQPSQLTSGLNNKAAARKQQGLDDRLEVGEILIQARYRWLRPAEVCEIILNHEIVGLSDEPANMPPSGSLFLYDRKLLRSFRKDGYKWKKTKDGKAVKEAHERLKVGRVEALHCYYAHGEENKNFQRRCFRMLKKDHSDVVLVHYREVKTPFSAAQSENETVGQISTDGVDNMLEFGTKRKVQNSWQGNKTNFIHVKETEEVVPYSTEAEETALHSEMKNSVSSSYSYQMCSQATEVTSLSSAQASEFEDEESGFYNQASSRWQPMAEKINAEFSDPYIPTTVLYGAEESSWTFPRDYHILIPRALAAAQASIMNLNHVKETEEVIPYYNEAEDRAWHSDMENSVSSSFSYQMCSQATDTTSLSSAQASEFEYTESDDYQEKFSTLPGVDGSTLTQACERLDSNDAGVSYDLRKISELLSDDVENSATGIQSVSFLPSFSATHTDTMENFPKRENDERLVSRIENKSKVQQSWQNLEGLSNWLMDQSLHSNTDYNVTTKILEGVDTTDLCKSLEPYLIESDKQNDVQIHLSNTDTISKRNDSIEGKADHASASKLLLDGSFGNGLTKLDNFNQCTSKDIDEPQMHSSSVAYWDTVGSGNEVDESSVPLQVRLDGNRLGPSLSNDQLFSIVDFSPNWAYENSEIEVFIRGTVLKTRQAEGCKWSCMFGKVETPAEVLADGVLRCYTPIHRAARVPFYITCSNRLACSEVKVFEYRVNQVQDADSKRDGCKDETLVMRFGNLLSVSSMHPSFNPQIKKRHKQYDPICVAHNSDLSGKINALLKNGSEERAQMLHLFLDKVSLERVKEQLLQQFLKDKFHQWLLQNLSVGGNGSIVRDEGGQGVLHIGASLGYDWVLLPMITAGVSVNFRDVNGWVALHWAAFCGREHTVALLINLGAAPGALTDPCTKYPTGKTPADLASEQGHKGIAGYLAESALNAHLSFLKLDIKDSAAISEAKSVQRVPEQISTSSWGGNLTDGLSLRACLVAVNNATQAAARIVQSFPRKQLKEYNGDQFGISNERDLSLTAVKSHEAGKHDERVDAAAIQNKDEVRGQKVTKNYRKILWAVGILEKIILRWRRKRCGLRGFKPEPLSGGPSMQGSSSRDTDYDFVIEGQKRTEERLMKAVARVKSMGLYPEARDQYLRLLNVTTEIQETKNHIMGKLDSRIGVFTLKVLRPTDHCELLSFIFAKSALPDDQSYILVRTDTYFLTRHMVWSLQPNGWLYGDVIDVFAEYLWLGGSKHDIYFPTHFSKQVDIDIGGRNKTDLDPTEFARCLRKVIGLKKFDEHISQCKKIFVPLHDDNHWYLLVVHIDSQVAEIWDSLNPTARRFNRRKHVLEALDILYDKVEFQLQKKNKFSSYRLSVPVQCPRQVGGSDCGVYVVRHMQSYGKEWWHEFDSQEQRMDLAIELVRNRFNLAWKDVSADMNE